MHLGSVRCGNADSEYRLPSFNQLTCDLQVQQLKQDKQDLADQMQQQQQTLQQAEQAIKVVSSDKVPVLKYHLRWQSLHSVHLSNSPNVCCCAFVVKMHV